MKTHRTVLRSSSHEDLLCIPGVCLGFRPAESCVVIGISGSEVAFCARCDLSWLEAQGAASLAERILTAASEVGNPTYVVIGYTQDPASAHRLLTTLSLALGENVIEVLLATAERYWRVTPGGIEPPEGHPWREQETNLAATAVYHGIQIASDREQVVSEVRPGDDQEENEYLISSAAGYLTGLTEQERITFLDHLLREEAELLPLEAAQLAVLVGGPSSAGQVVSELSPQTSGRIRRHLAAARRSCTRVEAPGVLAVLALACWFDNRAAQHTDCVMQLEALEPEHRLLPLLRALHHLAVRPPRSGMGPPNASIHH